MSYYDVALITPVLNNFEGYCNMIASIDEGPYISVAPIIVNNWKKNRGVAAGWNYGCQKAIEAGYDFLLVTNDDIIFSKDAILNMVLRLEEENKKPNNIIMVTGRQQRGNANFDGTIESLNKLKPPEGYDPAQDGDSPDFSCFMIMPYCFEVIGKFDENFKPAYFEDNDYHRRMHLMGFRAANLAASPIYHIGSQTQNNPAAKAPVVSGKAFENNRFYYSQKWGGIPGEEKFDTPFNRGGPVSDWDPNDRTTY